MPSRDPRGIDRELTIERFGPAVVPGRAGVEEEDFLHDPVERPVGVTETDAVQLSHLGQNPFLQS
ncbi:MAG: hypothetical protein MI702_11455, partial [Chlorobiales bacterium]|nr:hypothetical protein [Chlorobiales bacterium]